MAWVSPAGQVLVFLDPKHIDIIIKNPQMFGVTPEYINSTYVKYGEPIGHEGHAREEIIKHVVNQGWIRIRRYNRPYFFSINVGNIDHGTLRRLSKWASQTMLMNGEGGNTECKITSPTNTMSATLNDLVTDAAQKAA